MPSLQRADRCGRVDATIEQHGDEVDQLIGWAAVLVVAPLLTTLHELAHAAVALAVQPGRVIVQLGSGDLRRTLRVGRLEVRHRSPAWFWAGSFGVEGSAPSPRGQVAVSLAGPVSSLATGLVLLAVHWNASLPAGVAHLVSAGMVFSLVQFLATIVPLVYPAGMPGYAGLPSDGLRAVRALADLRAGRDELT